MVQGRKKIMTGLLEMKTLVIDDTGQARESLLFLISLATRLTSAVLKQRSVDNCENGQKKESSFLSQIIKIKLKTAVSLG